MTTVQDNLFPGGLCYRCLSARHQVKPSADDPVIAEVVQAVDDPFARSEGEFRDQAGGESDRGRR
jgi:hypothetical protein